MWQLVIDEKVSGGVVEVTGANTYTEILTALREEIRTSLEWGYIVEKALPGFIWHVRNKDEVYPVCVLTLMEIPDQEEDLEKMDYESQWGDENE